MVKRSFKIIIIGGIIMAMGILISAIANSTFTSVLWDSNASFSVYDQEFMSVEDWEAKAVDEFWIYSVLIIIGYATAWIGTIIVIIGGIRTIQDKRIANQ